MLKTRHREAILLDACFRARQRFVVENTNVTAEQRSRYIESARAADFRVTGFFFDVSPSEAARRNARRTGKQRVPVKAVYGTHARLEPPILEEGFDEIFRVTIGAGGEFVVEPLRAVGP